MTGGRLKRIQDYLEPNETFCMTYGDGLSNIDIRSAIQFHQSHGLLGTVSCVRPPARFGRIIMDGDKVVSFEEKPQAESGLINGGYFVLQREALDLIEDDATIWEREPMETLAQQGQLAAWRHEDFWQPMDTLRDKQQLNEMWDKDRAPWRVW